MRPIPAELRRRAMRGEPLPGEGASPSDGDRLLDLPPRMKVPATLELPAPPTPPPALHLPARRSTARPTQPQPSPDPPMPTATPCPTKIPPGASAVASIPPPPSSRTPTRQPPRTSVAPKRPQRKKTTRRGVPIPLWLLAAAALAIALVAADDHDEPQPVETQAQAQPPPDSETPAVQPSTAASPDPAVGMPIPTGNAPVRAVRIVLDVSDHELAPRERRELGNWIQSTQHARTRVRINAAKSLSAPLSGAQLAARSPAAARGAESAMRWLARGVRAGRRGGLVHLGTRNLAPFQRAGVRESDVVVTATMKRTRRGVAASIAREIMVVSRQREAGTPAP